MPLPPVARWPEVALTLGRTFGVRGALLRGAHEFRKMAGAFLETPGISAPLGGNGPTLFKIDPARLRSAGIDVAGAIARADRVVAGEYQAFGNEWRDLPSDAVGWRRHPGTGLLFPDAPWWKVPHLDGRIGDVKQVWEPSRFAWAYDLVRAWVLTSDPRYPAAFHRLLQEWVAASPPFRGPQWACGQESAIRAIALLHAEANFPASAEEAAQISAVLGWSGERIADAIGYAISQRNNHSLSEAAGLIALGVRMGTVHPAAARWLALGRRVLAREIVAQFAPDGWYIQHSFNYLRVALDQCSVAELALRAIDERLPDAARERLAAAVGLVSVLVGPDGSVPNHGANDGARVLPLSLVPFGDFRPVLTAASAILGLPLAGGVIPDRQTLAWLSLSPPATSAPIPDGAYQGKGWAVARVGRTSVFLRAGRYRSRPSHLDPLQVDVRLAGRPLIVDPGTFLYDGPAPWCNGLISALVHNGPVLDDREPGVRGPRFLWLLWPAARLLKVTWDGSRAVLEGASGGVVRRVLVEADQVEVRDRVTDRRAREIRVRWLLHPEADSSQVSVDGGGSLRDAVEGAVSGWFSPHYAERLPSRYIDVVRTAQSGAELVTRFHRAAPRGLPPSR